MGVAAGKGGGVVTTQALAIGRLVALLATVAALPAGARVFWPGAAVAVPGDTAPRPPAGTDSTPRPDSLESRLIVHDPFRPARRPAGVRFDPNPPLTPAAPRPPKPVLALTGIVWGKEPSAVVEGLPGVDGARLIRVGDDIAGFRIRRITAQQVTVTGMDTTWVLELRTPW
jgi:hypothetical protein